MEILARRQLWAPNVWAAVEVCDLRVCLGRAAPLAPPAALFDAIDRALPERAGLFGPFRPTAASGQAAFRDGPRLLAELALTLQSIARGPAPRFHRVLDTCDPRVFRVAIEARDPVLVVDCLEAALALLAAAPDPAALDAALEGLRERLVDRADQVCLGPSTTLIVRAAEARGIPWRRLGDLSLVQFGHGVHQRRIWTAETDHTPAIAEAISRNKQLTKRLLAAAGVPVPAGSLARSAREAGDAADRIGYPVVVKPLDGNHGRGVFLNLTGRDEVERAFAIALAEAREGSPVIVERFVTGLEHRLLVVGGRLVAAAKGEQLFVTGDGRATVAELIESQINSDARRGRSETLPNKTVELDSTVLAELGHSGVAPETVLAEGRRVLVKRIGSHGPDVTDLVHPEIAAAAVRAARTVGLDIAGIDLVADDISRPLSAQSACICEVNAGPQLLVHAHPESGPGRPVGEEIAAMLFASHDSGRVPILAILADDAAALARGVGERLVARGLTPAVCTSAGRWTGGWPCGDGPHTAAAIARDALVSPEIDAAVFELDWRSVLASGLPADRIDVLVLGRIQGGAESDPATAAVDTPLAVAEALLAAVPPAGSILLDGPPADIAARASRRARARPPGGPEALAEALAEWLAASGSDPVIAAIPLHEPADADSDRRRR